VLIAGHEKGQSWVRFLHSARLTGNLLTLGQIRHATIKTNDYYPLIARAVERLDRSTGEARRAVYERARKAVAELRSNQPALLDAEITEERLALEEAIRKVEAEAARKSPTEARAEPRSAAPSEGMPDGDNIQSRDHGQPASPDRDDRPPALPSRQAPIFLPTASDDRHNTDIQAVAIGGAYGADHYHDDIPGSRWRGGLLVVMAVLALAVLAGTFAYRAVFGGSVFPALPPIIKADTGPNDIVRNNSDTRRSNSSQTSVTSAGSSEKLQPMDIREAPKAVPRVISTIPISSKPSAAAVVPLAPAPAATAPALDPPVASALDQHVASVPPPASAPVPVPASSDRRRQRRSRRLVRLRPLLPRRCSRQHLSRRPPRLRCQYRLPRSRRSQRRSRRLRASRVRLRPLLPRRCSRQHLSRRPPRLRCQYRLPRSRRRLRRSRRLRASGVRLRRRCSRQHLSRRPPRLRCQYRLPRSRRRQRRSRRLHASRVRLRPLLPRPCSRQHLCLRPPRLPRNRRRFIGSSSPQMGGGKRIHPRRPRSLTLRGMRRRHRPLVLLCRRVAGPLWKCPSAAPTRFR
jgi:hypothetical protein